jgi:hypothetical protein
MDERTAPARRRLRETRADFYWRDHAAGAVEGVATLICLVAFCFSFA